MLPPAQSIKVQANLRDRFLEERKPIVKLRVLSLNDRSLSWIEDAKNCSRIYIRMLGSRAICPRILPLLSQWADLLLDYASFYGFGNPDIMLVKRKPSIYQSNEWLRRMLIEIKETPDADALYGRMVTGFRPEEIREGKKGACCITHKPFKPSSKAVTWLTTLEFKQNMTDSYDSLPTERDVFKWLERLVKQGLKRHRRLGYRQNLKAKILKRKFNGKI